MIFLFPSFRVGYSYILQLLGLFWCCLGYQPFVSHLRRNVPVNRGQGQPVYGVRGCHRRKLNVNCAPIAPHVLKQPTLCRNCGARLFEYESKRFCCSGGKIVLKMNVVPDELYELFVSSAESREVKRCSRIYNSNFAFTSLGVNYDCELSSMNKGIYTFRIQGQVYHRINQLLPSDKPPSFFQLYFYDTEHELENRLNFSDQMSASIVRKISDVLRVNPYCQFFRSLRDVPNLPAKEIHIRCDSGLDQRTYNAPIASQVTAILVEKDLTNRELVHDIVISTHTGDHHWINYRNGCYVPL